MIPHHEDLAAILKHLLVEPEQGLTSAEAKRRLAEYGENKLQERKKKTIVQRFFEQFSDVMILILIAAAVVSFVIACYEREGFSSQF